MGLLEELNKRFTELSEKTDFIDDTEAAMDFEDLPDQDIDNDGDSDESDEYLHNRLGTIAKMDESATDRFLQSAAGNLAKQMRGKSASRTTLMNRLNRMPLANRLKPDELEKIIDYTMKEIGLDEIEEATDINDPVLMAFRAAKMKREKELAKPKRRPLYGKQREKAEDELWDISLELKDLYADRGQMLIDMEQEAEVEGGPIADEYGDKLNKIEDEIQKLIAKRSRLEIRLAEGKENEIDEANVTANLDGGAGPMRTPRAFGRKEDERGSAEKLGMKKTQKSNRHFRKMESRSSYKTMMAEMYGVGEVNESVSYTDYKKDPKATPQQKVNKGIAEINNMLAEIERMVQNNVRLKQEMGVNSSHFWKATGKRFAKINERMTRISNRLRELSK